jgi:CRP/FNR family transcriptional regulator, cyclic AMP receptor protein
MRTVEQLLGDVPALGDLSLEHRRVIAGCAVNRIFEAEEYLLREGEPADVFFVIRKGLVALETFVPERGALTVQTLHDGDLLGWSWLVPPYRVAFDARALSRTHALSFDASCLRGKCDQDPALGYDLLRLFAGVIVQRLQNTRVQLLDVYGAVAAS